MAISVALNSAMRSLLAQQQAMDAVAHNIANVNTPGYSRQRVTLSPVAPADGSGIGGGVSFDGVQRVRDMFVDFQVRVQQQGAGFHEARADSLHLAELAFNEPSETGLRSVMDAFWNAWRDLGNAPEQGAARSAVVQSGETLAVTASHLVRSLGALRDNADARLASAVDEVNGLTSRIAALNGQIVGIRATGDPASDLSDQRDLALDRLAKLVDVQYHELDNGRIDVFAGGRSLVSGLHTETVEGVQDPGNDNYLALQWASDGAAASLQGGEVGGLLHQRDADLPGRLDDLNTLVAQVIQDVNVVHAAGFAQDGVTTGTAFFAGTDATDIAVDGAVASNPGLLAAAAVPDATGDGSNALQLAGLQSALTLDGGSRTFGDFYNGIVTSLGVAVQDAQRMAESQRLTLDHLEQLRQSGSGVNLDEELVNMVQFQRGYESAARIIRAVDEMLDTLINRT